MRKLLIVLSVLLFALPCFAADHYIRDGGTGDGTAWNNALDDLPATLTRGDTYYIADGTYASYIFDDAVSGSTYIYIKKATVAAHGTETGWDNAYGDGTATWTVAVTTSTVRVWKVTTGYWEFDGVTGTGKDATYGFKVTATGAAGTGNARLIEVLSPIDYLILKHIEFENRGLFAIDPADDCAYFNVGSGEANNWTISDCYFNSADRLLIYFQRVSDVLIEDTYFYLNESNAASHSEAIQNGLVSANNVVIKFCTFEDIEGTGVLSLCNADQWHIFGNIFFYSASYPHTNQNGTGCSFLVGTSSGYGGDGIYFYNNTIYNMSGYNSAMGLGDYSTDYNEHNNIWDNNEKLKFTEGATEDYNAEYNTGTIYGSMGANSVNLGSSVLTDPSGGDYALSTPLSGSDPSGLFAPDSWPTDWNKDPDGITRGATGAWDMGAYEFDPEGEASGTIIPGGCQEGAIRTGGETIQIDIVGDTLVAAGATFDAQRQNVINGMDSAQSEAAGWDVVVKGELPVTAVVRVDNNTILITLTDFDGDPYTLYQITANEIVEVTLPSTVLVGGVAIVCTPTFQVSAEQIGAESVSVVYDVTGPAAVYDSTGPTVN